jgi:hypothetical protein
MGQHGVEIVLHALEAAARAVNTDNNPLGDTLGSQNANARL